MEKVGAEQGSRALYKVRTRLSLARVIALTRMFLITSAFQQQL
jgi:hypothetical protein